MNSLLLRLAFAGIMVPVATCSAVNDSLYFLFQRSTYLENLCMPGGWWANPAVTAEVVRKTALSVNVSPVGNVFTIASAKYLAPLGDRCGVGIGLMGSGINPNPDGSLQATNSGAQYQSHFTFSNPSIQLAVGVKILRGWTAGFMGDFGWELMPDGIGGQIMYPTLGIGLGAMTPYLFDRVSFSVSSMSTGHLWQQTYWDYDGKAGLRFKTVDSLCIGSFEYTFSFSSGTITSIYNSPDFYYQVVKALVSIKMYSIAGLLVGYSQDIGNLSDNGNLIHAGVELRQSQVYPFFGGYEMGIGLTQLHRDLLVHRLWVGYNFGSN